MKASHCLGPICFVIALLFLNGCGYTRGLWNKQENSLEKSPSSYYIAVAPIKNSSLAPQAIGILSEQLRRCFLQQRVWILTDEAHADLVLEICLKNFKTHCTDTGKIYPKALHLELEASVSLYATSNRSYEFKNSIFSSEIDDDTFDDEDIYYTAIPALTRTLSEKIFRAITFARHHPSEKNR